MGVFWTDTSYFQTAVDSSYPYPFISIRISDGAFLDPLFSTNYHWCVNSKVTGIIGYHVYRPNLTPMQQFQNIVNAVGPNPDKRLVIMVDVETWQGAIIGNHSADITSLISQLANWLGNPRRVIAYGNTYDLAEIYPSRPSNLKLIIASYGSVMPQVPNQIGWQYYGGDPSYPVPDGFPTYTTPFGQCDHNYSPLSAPQLAQALGIGSVSPSPTPSKGKDEMFTLYQVVHGPTHGRQYAVSTHTKPFWLTSTDKATFIRFNWFINPTQAKGIEQVEIDRLIGAFQKTK